MRSMISLLSGVGLVLTGFAFAYSAETESNLKLEANGSGDQMNVIYILADDHRYDVMGFLDHPFVQTPVMDSMAEKGVYFKNAFVTTSLCSPSRASILTGQYMHQHGVVDNNNLARPGTVFFPQYLQQVGYQTAFIGKWHMGGHSDDPRPGFDHWVSFKGQGHYNPPEKSLWTLNVNGKSVPQEGYITDELTDYAVNWLKEERDDSKPFCMYLSHKAVHGMFYPAERHAGRYKDEKMPVPSTMANTDENYAGKPMWLKNQRNSWHGVDFAYHQDTNIEEHYQLYCEALLAVDESIGRVWSYVKEAGLEDNTLIIYMGDNGFQWGEHGLIDKRTAYEASMRVPMLAYCPSKFPAGTVVDEVVANIDIAPTILAAAGLKSPPQMDGRSFLGMVAGEEETEKWRDYLLYEYYWEWNFPHTPTTFAIRGDRYKFIQYHGIWDTDELYDLQNDPDEKENLVNKPEHKELVRDLRIRLHELLATTGGDQVPFGRKMGSGANLRNREGSNAADFPEDVFPE
ncbi:Arylsulfatase [Polystyrenella longa]|uniref:Arylsulfatase n=1 Tax=Polystyrenella longa TaxID=2528007 RepID=A0A518CR56_9PLAN|nr:sulfatase [Polystyrenella longa]QDU81707.1 Arylsulfatase [Polystyrenella longa]